MLEIIFYIVVFFPFVKLLGINLGTGNGIQLYSLFFMIAMLFLYIKRRKIKITKKMRNLYITIMVSTIIALIFSIPLQEELLFNLVRYASIYFSVICSSFVSYEFIKKNDGIDEKKIKVIINIYLVVGLIQKYISRSFAYFLIGFTRTTDSRGEISLTSEPSYYGYMCVFFLLMAFEFKKNRKFYIFNTLFQIIIIAKSSVAILYLAILVCLYGIIYMRNLNLKKLAVCMTTIIGIAVGVIYIMKSPGFEGQRIVFFLNILLNSGDLNVVIEKLSTDGSTIIRFRQIAVCFQEFFKNYGLPNGLASEIVQSGYGSFIYPLGIFGFIIIGQIYMIIRSAYQGVKKKIIPLYITIIMFSLIQISNPVYTFLLGWFMYKSSEIVVLPKSRMVKKETENLE